MGGTPWMYLVPYRPDINGALQDLRKAEFVAGRYFPVIPAAPDRLAAAPPSFPGPRHSSIEEAVRAAGESGTRSILDMHRTGDIPGYGIVAAVPAARLIELFGTDQPSRSVIEANLDFLGDIERGQGIYIVIYENGSPQQILFAGYSYD